MTITPMRATAHHESAHAVVALELGMKVVKLALSPPGHDRLGSCQYTDSGNMAKAITVQLAGLLGERMFLLHNGGLAAAEALAPAHGDDDKVRDLLEPHCHSRPIAIAYFPIVEAAKARAAKILKSRWDDVTTLAMALLDRIELDADQVTEILGRARTERACQRIQKAKTAHPQPKVSTDSELLWVVDYCLGVAKVRPVRSELRLSAAEFDLIIDCCEDVGRGGGIAARPRVLREIERRKARRAPSGGVRWRDQCRNPARPHAARPYRRPGRERRLVVPSV